MHCTVPYFPFVIAIYAVSLALGPIIPTRTANEALHMICRWKCSKPLSFDVHVLLRHSVHLVGAKVLLSEVCLVEAYDLVLQCSRLEAWLLQSSG